MISAGRLLTGGDFHDHQVCAAGGSGHSDSIQDPIGRKEKPRFEWFELELLLIVPHFESHHQSNWADHRGWSSGCQHLFFNFRYLSDQKLSPNRSDTLGFVYAGIGTNITVIGTWKSGMTNAHPAV